MRFWALLWRSKYLYDASSNYKAPCREDFAENSLLTAFPFHHDGRKISSTSCMLAEKLSIPTHIFIISVLRYDVASSTHKKSVLWVENLWIFGVSLSLPSLDSTHASSFLHSNPRACRKMHVKRWIEKKEILINMICGGGWSGEDFYDILTMMFLLPLSSSSLFHPSSRPIEIYVIKKYEFLHNQYYVQQFFLDGKILSFPFSCCLPSLLGALFFSWPSSVSSNMRITPVEPQTWSCFFNYTNFRLCSFVLQRNTRETNLFAFFRSFMFFLLMLINLSLLPTRPRATCSATDNEFSVAAPLATTCGLAVRFEHMPSWMFNWMKKFLVHSEEGWWVFLCILFRAVYQSRRPENEF